MVCWFFSKKPRISLIGGIAESEEKVAVCPLKTCRYKVGGTADASIGLLVFLKKPRISLIGGIAESKKKVAVCPPKTHR